MTLVPAESPAGATAPFVTVIVLNYNAERFIGPCLRSLLASDYPRDSLEIVVVDNASTDGSAELIHNQFSGVRLVHAGSNRGFAAGNNLAMRQAPGPYIGLVNPDTKVAANWLSPLVAAMTGDAGTGATQAKLYLFHDQIPVQIRSSTFVPSECGLSGDERTLGLRIGKVQVTANGEPLSTTFRSGFGGVELNEHGVAFRWSLGNGELGLVNSGNGSIQVELEVSAPRPDPGATHFTIEIDGRPCFTGKASQQTEKFEFAIPDEWRNLGKPVVQNAGSHPLPDGSSRDRGTIVSHGNVYCDWDGPAYSAAQEVFAFNGAGVLLRKTMLDEIGYFDENMFMYYEDTDLSIRARRRGWRVVFVPESTIRHHHSGVSIEWSPLFVLHVSRSRMYVILKHWPLNVALRALANHTAETFAAGARLGKQILLQRPHNSQQLAHFIARLKSLLITIQHLPKALAKRGAERRAGALNMELFRPWMIEE